MYGGFFNALKRATRYRTRRREFGAEPPDFHVVRRRRRPREGTPAWSIVLPGVALGAFAAAVHWHVSTDSYQRIPPAVSVLIVVVLGVVFAVRAWASDVAWYWRYPSTAVAVACVALGAWWFAI